jgi:hypothetical protein
LSGRAGILGLAFLTLAVGLCLFDGDETGTPGHLSPPDLCGGLALFVFAVTLLGLAARGDVFVSPAAATSALRGAGWNRFEAPPLSQSPPAISSSRWRS